MSDYSFDYYARLYDEDVLDDPTEEDLDELTDEEEDERPGRRRPGHQKHPNRRRMVRRMRMLVKG